MKISKIFHWLYAFLMSLPIVAVLTTSLYVVFNPNAMESTSITETQYRKVEYQTNEVNSVDDLVVGNVYEIQFTQTLGNTIEILIGNNNDIDFLYLKYIPYNMSNFNYYIRTSVTNTANAFLIGKVPGENANYISLGYSLAFTNQIVRLPIIYKGNTQGYINNDTIAYFKEADLTNITPQYEEIETTTLDNAFSWAVNSINDNPLFSWASASFLVQPFHYIGNVFGLPITSPINTLLSYWLDISIIWLVFDLIMYLPLLAHRWLDKGVLE